MKELLIKILAALKVTPPADATEEQLIALVAKQTTDNAELAKQVAEIQARYAAEQKAKADAEAKAKAEAEVIAKQKADAEIKAKADAAAAELAEIKARLAAIDAGSGGRAGPGITSVKANPFEAIKAMLKEKDHRKRGQIYCSDLREFVSVTAHLAEILAANSFGTVTADLIVLRALDLLKLNFPVLSRVTTDFSDQAVRQGQSIKTRIVSVPSVVTYDNTTGWSSSDGTTTDVPVSIGQPVGVQIELTTTEVAGSNRDLFAEQVEASHYALGKNLVDALYAVITQANFSGAAKRTIKALASFTRSDVVDMGTALGKRGVGLDRTLLLNSDYYGALSKDLIAIGNAALVDRSVIAKRELPMLHNFSVVEASNLPANAFTSTTGTLQGFGFTRDALVIATRIPEDYSRALPGASNGNISVVTNPDTGISVQKTDFVDHKLARAYSRLALSYGVAKGQVNSGQCLTET